MPSQHLLRPIRRVSVSVLLCLAAGLLPSLSRPMNAATATPDTSVTLIKATPADWSPRKGTLLEALPDGGLRLESRPGQPAVADASLARLASKPAKSDVLRGTVYFDYRGTPSPEAGQAYAAVAVMAWGDVREAPGRRWLVLHDADPRQWKTGHLKFDFPPDTTRASILRLVTGQGEIPQTLTGSSTLEIRNLRLEIPQSPTLPPGLVDFAPLLKIHAPRATYADAQELVTGRFQRHGPGYFGLFPDADNPDNNWMEAIVPSPRPVQLRQIVFHRLQPGHTRGKSTNAALLKSRLDPPGNSYTLSAFDGSSWRDCPLDRSTTDNTDGRLVFDIPDGLLSTRYRLHLRVPGRSMEYRLYQINAYGEPGALSSAFASGGAAALSVICNPGDPVFEAGGKITASLRFPASSQFSATPAVWRARLLDHYGDPLAEAAEFSGEFDLGNGLESTLSWPALPSGSYRIEAEASAAGHVFDIVRIQLGVRGNALPFEERQPQSVQSAHAQRRDGKRFAPFSAVIGHFYSRPQKFPLASLRRIKEGGYDGVTLFLHWSELEPFPGIYNVAHLDETLRRCSELGLAAELYIVVGDKATPAWVPESQFQRDQNDKPVGSRWYLHLPSDEPGRIPSPQAPVMTENYPALYATLARHYKKSTALAAWYIGPPALEVFFWTPPRDEQKGIVSDFSNWNIAGFRSFLRDELRLDPGKLGALWSTPVNGQDDIFPVKPSFVDGYDLRVETILYHRYKHFVAARFYERCIAAVRESRPDDMFFASELAEYPVWEDDARLVRRVGRGGAAPDRIGSKLHALDTDVNSGPALGLVKSQKLPGGYEHGWVPPRPELFHYGFFNLFTNGFSTGDYWRWQGEPVYGALWKRVPQLRAALEQFAGAVPHESGVAALISDRSLAALQRFGYKWGAPLAAPGAPLHRVKGGLIGALADMEYQWGEKLAWLPVEAGLPDLSGKRLIFDLYSLYLSTSAQEQLLTWVKEGGTLVLTGVSGLRESPGSNDASLRKRIFGSDVLPIFENKPAKISPVADHSNAPPLLPTTHPFGMNVYQGVVAKNSIPLARTDDGRVAASLHREGRGQVVLLHGDINGFRYGDHRTFFNDLRTLAAPPPSPVTVETPHLQAMLTQRDGKRFLFIYHHATDHAGAGALRVATGEKITASQVTQLYPPPHSSSPAPQALVSVETENDRHCRLNVITQPYDLLIFSIGGTR